MENVNKDKVIILLSLEKITKYIFLFYNKRDP